MNNVTVSDAEVSFAASLYEAFRRPRGVARGLISAQAHRAGQYDVASCILFGADVRGAR
jgi:hypothetical protein